MTEPVDAEPTASKAKRILVVDDEPITLQRIEDNLERTGYEVETVSNGIEALAAIRAQRPHLLITDVMMPKMDGFELRQVIRSDPELVHLPILMMTAKIAINRAEFFASMGADRTNRFIEKPFNLDQLCAIVDEMLVNPAEEDEPAKDE